MQPSLKNRYAEQNVIDVTENKHRFVANSVDFSDGYIRCGVPIIGRQHCRLTICMELVELTNSIRQQDQNIYSDTEARCLV